MGFLGGAALLTAAVAVSKLLGALYKIPLGNLLGSRGMGCFQAAYNVYGVLLTLSTAGLPLAMSRLIAQSRGQTPAAAAHFPCGAGVISGAGAGGQRCDADLSPAAGGPAAQ